MDWDSKQYYKRKRARERARMAKEARQSVHPLVAEITEGEPLGDGYNPTRYDINDYRGGPGHIRDVGVIEKRKG